VFFAIKEKRRKQSLQVTEKKSPTRKGNNLVEIDHPQLALHDRARFA